MNIYVGNLSYGMSESELRDAFAAKLDRDRFSVEVDDGEDVLIKKRGGAPDFDLVLVSNDVKSVRLHVDRE